MVEKPTDDYAKEYLGVKNARKEKKYYATFGQYVLTPEVFEELDREIDFALPRELILDLGGLTFTDSSGIAVVLRAWRRMGQLRGNLLVVNAPPQADKVFRAAGLDRLVRFE